MKRILPVLLYSLLIIMTTFSGCEANRDPSPSSGNIAQKDRNDKGAADKKVINYEEYMSVDISDLKSNDGQPLILPLEKKVIPARPADPLMLPETDPLHWFDAEYAGWETEKVNLPKSPGDGPKGKKVVMIVAGEHPYFTAVGIGAEKVADAYGINYRMLNAKYDLSRQNQLIQETIKERPDMILLVAVNAKASVEQAREINKAGIPLIMFNTIPDTEALKYALAFTGPDDWGQFRMLARTFADRLGKKGGVAYITHIPGGSPYYARAMGPITELHDYAPQMKTLDVQSPGFDADKCKTVVEGWLSKYGNNLNGIICADDNIQATGIIDAINEAKRKDIVVVAAGNSRIGMDAVKSGDLFAITYQSAEADGATPMKLAADWFAGEKIDNVAYITKAIITKENVDNFMPAQW